MNVEKIRGYRIFEIVVVVVVTDATLLMSRLAPIEEAMPIAI